MDYEDYMNYFSIKGNIGSHTGDVYIPNYQYKPVKVCKEDADSLKNNAFELFGEIKCHIGNISKGGPRQIRDEDGKDINYLYFAERGCISDFGGRPPKEFLFVYVGFDYNNTYIHCLQHYNRRIFSACINAENIIHSMRGEGYDVYSKYPRYEEYEYLYYK